jgi:hypothetical protein
MTMSQKLSVIDFVAELRRISDNIQADEDFDFSILVEMNPIKNKYTYVCKVLSIIISLGCKNTIEYIHFDKVQENDLNYIEIKDNHTRKVGVRKTPFFIDGVSHLQEFNGNNYIEYSLRNPKHSELKFIEKLREKYNIIAPRNFVGKNLTFTKDSL